MKFYTNIADYYDYIFPYNQIHKNFIQSCDGNTSYKSLLDIGCGTGNLSIELAKEFGRVTAIDLDASMIGKANTKSENINNLEFISMNMMDTKKQFRENSFDYAFSFGNTLVHLNDLNEINTFFSNIRNLLKPSSPFLFQIINYERILAKDIHSLSTIDNEYIRFERNYNYDKLHNTIEFSTLLTIKKTGVILPNKVNLYPLLPVEILDILSSNSFTGTNLYGSFIKDNFTRDSIPLIIETYNGN